MYQQQAQYAQCQNAQYGQDSGTGRSGGVYGSRIEHQETQASRNKELVSVIVTISKDSSYDQLFTSIPQLAPNGRVSVFAVAPHALSYLLSSLKNENCTETVPQSFVELVTEIKKEISSLPPESTVFNWECCSAWSCQSFQTFKSVTMNFLQFALQSGFMVMFSDFALKALIADWSEAHLGPNPFVQLGEFYDSFDLKFDPTVLKDCVSTQLQKVGELCDKGEATVHALGGTIVFGLNSNVKPCKEYTLEVLTVATRLGSFDLTRYQQTLCKIGSHKGAAGHIMLKYPSGGVLLLSAGHWIELSRLDTSVESVLRVAQNDYGVDYSNQIRNEYSNARSESMRQQVVQKWACQMVQQNAPCKNYKY